MLEELIFGSMTLPGENFRIALAIIGTLAATYYDLFNNKNIPNNLLYLFLAVAFITNIFFFNQELFLIGITTAVIIGLLGYLLYKSGQMGAADIFVLASIALLLPIAPSFAKLPFNFPFIAIIFIFASLLFALYTLFYFGSKIITEKHSKPKLFYLLLLVPYAIFTYIFVNSIFFSIVYFTIISIAYLSSVFVMMYRDSINKKLAEKVRVSKLQEEDVLALELMDEKIVKKYSLQKVLTKKEIAKLKRAKLDTVLVYTRLPPFLPFIFAGLLFALVFGKNLLFSF